jgi:methionyl-tRNA synthetase
MRHCTRPGGGLESPQLIEKRKGEAVAEEKPTITFDDFLKLDLRVATVVEASDHPNADKLIVLKIDLGGEQRQIIAGLKGFYAPESLMGKQLVVVTNLAPRKMRGLESNGMLLAATVGGMKRMSDVVVLVPEKQVPPGTPVS